MESAFTDSTFEGTSPQSIGRSELLPIKCLPEFDVGIAAKNPRMLDKASPLLVSDESDLS